MEVAEQLHAPDYQLITPRGKALSKTEYLHAVATRELHYSAFEAITPMDVWGDEQIALIRYRARIGFHDSPAPPIECWHTDCYRSNDGNWQAGRVVTSDNGSVIRRSRRKYHTVCPAAGNGPPDADIVHDPPWV